MVLKPRKGRSLRLLVTAVCGCAFSLFGYDQALYGGVASGDAFVEQFNHPSASLNGHTAAIYDIGCLVGAVCSSYVAHRLGHKKTLVRSFTIPCLINKGTRKTQAQVGKIKKPFLMTDKIV